MKKTLGIALTVFCMAIIESAAKIPDSNAGLEKALAKYNYWKVTHPNAIVRFEANVFRSYKGRPLEVNEIVTTYYLANKIKILTQVFDPNHDSCIEFLSDNGDLLCYFPSTRLTVREDSPLKTYVLREMGWDQPLTVSKVKSLGGKLEYRWEHNLDCLIIKLPLHPVPGEVSKKPISYAYTLELLIDKSGKVIKQIATFHNSPSISADMEYLTFDAEKVKAGYNNLVVKSVVNKGVTMESAFIAESKKNHSIATASSPRALTTIAIRIGLFCIIILLSSLILKWLFSNGKTS